MRFIYFGGEAGILKNFGFPQCKTNSKLDFWEKRQGFHGEASWDIFYRKIHYLTREFRAKLHAKTDTAIWAISVYKCNLTLNSRVRYWIFLESHNWIKIRKKENNNNIICLYPERTLQKAISKSTVRTVIVFAHRKQGQPYTFNNFNNNTCTLCLCLHLFSNFLNKLHTNLKDK